MPAPPPPSPATQLKKRGIQNIADLNDVLPGLTVANNGVNREVWIRGIGSSNNTELGDPAAATHWDGVYLPRPSGIGSAFFDIQRVEVNVGPQGTLRGRNATAGSVNVITWKPGLGVWDAELEGEYGNYNQKVVRGMLNIPIGDTVAVRLSGLGLSHDSYYKNVGPVRTSTSPKPKTISPDAPRYLWKPSDRCASCLPPTTCTKPAPAGPEPTMPTRLATGSTRTISRTRVTWLHAAFTPDLDIKH